MRYGLAIGLLCILTLLLHDVCMQVAGENSPTHPSHCLQKRHSLSQDKPVHDAIEHLFRLYASQPGDMSHMDDNHIPADKAIQLFTACFTVPDASHLSSSLSTSHAPSPPVHPVVHYVYGLRKIII